MSVQSAASDKYTALRGNQLKATTVSKIEKFWTSAVKNLNADWKSSEPGLLCSVELVGKYFLVDQLQPYATAGKMRDGGELVEGFELFSLAELANSKAAERELVQFDIIPTKVESFLTATDNGLLKINHFIMPIEVLRTSDGTEIIGGGRHRTTALLTLCKYCEGWENLVVACRVRDVKTTDEAVAYITASNGSRSMTTTEKAMLKAAKQGITVVRSGDELLESMEKFDSLTDIKRVASLFFVSKAAEEYDAFASAHPEVSSVTNDTMGKFGSSILNNVSNLMKKFGKSAPKDILTSEVAVDDNGNTARMSAVLTEYAYRVLRDTWAELVDSVKQAKISRKTGEPETDADGNIIYQYPVARSTSSIAKDVAESIFAELEATFAEAYSSEQQRKKAEKQAKEAEKEAKQAQSAAKEAERVAQYIQSLGVNMPPEMAEALEQAKAQAALAQTAEAESPVDQPTQLKRGLAELLN